MGEHARVDNVDALKIFRAALFKFAEEANNALGDAEGEMHRTLNWLENEQIQHWTNQIRKRHEDLNKAKEALRMKTAFKDATGSQQSAVEEQKAVNLAKRRMEEAEQKLVLTKQHSRKLQKEIQLYRGAVQRFSTTLSSDIPIAASKLEQAVIKLEAYVALNAPEAVSMPVSASSTAGSSISGSESSAAPASDRPISPWQKLRSLTPEPAIRASAEDGGLPTVEWAVPPLGESARQILAEARAGREPVDPNSSFVLAQGIYQDSAIYLQRLEPAFPGDSGWFLGPVDPRADMRFVSVRISELETVRPDLRDALPMPAGSLLVVDGGGLAAMLDAAGVDQRPVAAEVPAAAAEPAPAAPAEAAAAS
jgi:hypothetical protein